MLYPLSYTGTIPVAGFEPATTRLRGDGTLIFTTGRTCLHSANFFFPSGDSRLNPLHFFAIGLPLVDRDAVTPPGQLQVLSLDDIPVGATAATWDAYVFMSDPIPLALDQLVALATVEFHLVDLLSQQTLLLPLASALPRCETQQSAPGMHKESLDAMSPSPGVNLAVCADPAIGFDHVLEVIENVLPRHLADVETLAQLAVNLVPGPPEIAA